MNYRNTWQLNEDAGWVAQTHDLLDNTTDVLLTIVDAETGERGYLISSREERFLDPYNAALTRLDNRLAALKEKTDKVPSLREDFHSLVNLTGERVKTLKQSIELRRLNQSGLGAYIRLVSKGKEQMDKVRDVIADMQVQERIQLQSRQEQTNNTYRTALATGLATALLGLVMVGAFVWLLDRNLQTRQKAAAEVHEQREWFRTTLSSIGDAVVSTDTRGRVAFLNPIAESLTGWTQDEAQGQPLDVVFRIVNEQSRQEVDNPALRALKDGQIVGLANHTLLIARDGTERPIADSAAPVRDDKGRIVGAVLTFHDITERRRMDRELQARAEELTDADRRKNEFLAMLAHELRNPLAPIRNALQFLAAAGANGETFAQVQGILDRQLRQMVRLVDDLLDVSRISRGKIELRLERVSVADAVEEALETCRPIIEEAKHELTVKLPPQPLSILGDSTRLAQVLSNLLNNSAKYTPDAGHIWLTVESDEERVAIRVRDNGVGIPAEMLPTVFEMFTQADRSLHRAQGGLGIGLTLARRLVEMHGGTIAAHSAGMGLGSEFVVTLPLAREIEKASPGEPRVDRVDAGKRAERRILVVDDNKDSAESLSLLLVGLGNQVRIANDGPSALEAARQFHPEVVLLDIGMPGMNGYEVARRMGTMPEVQNAVLVAQTGWGQEEDRCRSHEAGFDDHLVKPIDVGDVIRLLSSLATER